MVSIADYAIIKKRMNSYPARNHSTRVEKTKVFDKICGDLHFGVARMDLVVNVRLCLLYFIDFIVIIECPLRIHHSVLRLHIS